MTTLSILLIVAAFWIMAYQRVSQPTLFLAIGVMLGGVGTWLSNTQPWLLLPWLLPAALFAVVAVGRWRKQLLTRPLLRQFRKVMPPMSRTEREALEAGSVWWDRELFTGKPDWQRLAHVPAPGLTNAEQAFLDGPTQRLCDMLDDWKITHESHDLPEPVWAFIKRERFFAMIIPENHGGLGFSALAHSNVVMKIASRSITAAVTVMVPNSLGPGKLLLHYGTEQQKAWYLPRLADGREIPCFALTGPNAGSDAGAIPDSGVVSYGEFQGRRILGIRLNWEKRYITLGPVATVIGLAFKLYDPDHHLGEQSELGITCALIPRDTPGVRIGQRHFPLNIPFQNGPNWGENVFIPFDWLIGGRERIGQGWRMLVESLAEGRGISLPALATGAGKAACRYTGAYAAIRKQFSLPIGRFEGVQESLARIAGMTYQMDAARLLTLSALDIGEKPSVITAIVKYHLTERYRKVINDAMDIQGGSGICLGPSNLIGRAYQAIPIAITVEGANILTRSMIIFGQGAVRCHPWMLQEFRAARQSNQRRALQSFDEALLGHAGFMISNLVRCITLGLTRGRFSSAPGKGKAKRYYQRLNWMSASFALSADIAMMTLGGALKRKERLSARLGDILSELYICSAVLKHYQSNGSPAEEEALLTWACEDSLYRMQESFRGLFRNLPWRPLGHLMRWLVFPSGQPFTEPTDRVGGAAAGLLLRPSASRDRLTDGVYITADPAQRVGQLEAAFRMAALAEPIEKTLRNARHEGLIKGKRIDDLAAQALEAGLISQQDVELLQRMEALRAQVIGVDAFDDLMSTAARDTERTSTSPSNPAKHDEEAA